MKTQNAQQPPQENQPSAAKRLGLGAFSISLIIHGIFAIIAIFFLFKWVYPPDPEVTATLPGDGGGGSGRENVSKVQIQHRQSMASASNPKIRSTAITNLALPDASPEMPDAALPVSLSDFGRSGLGGGGGGGNGFGNGPGSGPGNGLGIGPGGGTGFMTPFGTNVAVDGSMPGHFYDFKQTAKGKPVENYNVQGSDFTNNVIKIQEEGFRESAFRKFFKAPDSLYLAQLAIPTTDAATGPRFFNVADKVKPSGWLVVYDGSISTTRDMTFRFVGIGDDYISVFNNRRPKLINAWPDMRQSVLGRWTPSESIDINAASPMPGGQLVKGDWITLKRGEKFAISIAIGERPGGKVGFVLMVEEKDAKYRTGSNGAKVLPLFTTQSITQTSRERITKDFKNWEFEWENVPVFAVDKASGMSSDF